MHCPSSTTFARKSMSYNNTTTTIVALYDYYQNDYHESNKLMMLMFYHLISDILINEVEYHQSMYIQRQWRAVLYPSDLVPPQTRKD